MTSTAGGRNTEASLRILRKRITTSLMSRLNMLMNLVASWPLKRFVHVWFFTHHVIRYHCYECSASCVVLQAFRQLSHRFHGKGSGKMKTERRMKKLEEEAVCSLDIAKHIRTCSTIKLGIKWNLQLVFSSLLWWTKKKNGGQDLSIGNWFDCCRLLLLQSHVKK